MARTTVPMGLKVWDSPLDNFHYTDLRDNWDAIDTHDHTTTKGVQIPAGGIQNGAISTAKLADDSVTQAKFAPGNGSLGYGAFYAGSTGAPYATNNTYIFEVEHFDSNNWYDPTTGVWTPQVAAVWDIWWSVDIPGASTLTANQWFLTWLKINGVNSTPGDYVYCPSSGWVGGVSAGRAFYQSSVGDDIHIMVVHNHGSAFLMGTGATRTQFGARLVYTL